MKRQAAALLAGVVFGSGLVVSGMTRPDKVVGFLDVLGDWDSTLGVVMAAALVVFRLLRHIARARSAPVFEARFAEPTRRDFDGRLFAGATLFGLGWGLGGYCPGPALTSILPGGTQALVFSGSMLTGMYVFHLGERRRQRRATVTA